MAETQFFFQPSNLPLNLLDLHSVFARQEEKSYVRYCLVTKVYKGSYKG